MPRVIIAVSAAMLISGNASAAGRIITPFLFSGINDQLVCVGTNVSAKPITMTVRVVGSLTDIVKTCTVAPTSRAGCQVFMKNQNAYCRISVSAMTTGEVQTNVRGVLFTENLDTMAPGAAVPAQ